MAAVVVLAARSQLADRYKLHNEQVEVIRDALEHGTEKTKDVTDGRLPKTYKKQQTGSHRWNKKYATKPGK